MTTLELDLINAFDVHSVEEVRAVLDAGLDPCIPIDTPREGHLRQYSVIASGRRTKRAGDQCPESLPATQGKSLTRWAFKPISYKENEFDNLVPRWCVFRILVRLVPRHSFNRPWKT